MKRGWNYWGLLLLDLQALLTTMAFLSLIASFPQTIPAHHRYVFGHYACTFLIIISCIAYNGMGISSFRWCTTILVVFDWTQICMIVEKFASVFWVPGLVNRMRIGSQRIQPCYKFWSLYKLWFWMQSLSSMSLVMKQHTLGQMGKEDRLSTMRMSLFYPWRQWCTH